MKQTVIHIPVQIGAADFRRFALFDAFRRKKMWKRPALFAAILGLSSLLCFSRYPQEGALLLGFVLLGVGVGLPLVWYLSFEYSLRGQAKKMRLSSPRQVYTLAFSDSGIEVSQDNGKSFSPLSWDGVGEVYVRSDVSYLYLDTAHAYLLPHRCIREGEAAFRAMLERCLPAEKLHIDKK